MARPKNIKYLKIKKEDVEKIRERINTRVNNSIKNANKIMQKWHVPRKIFKNYEEIEHGFANHYDDRLKGAILNPRYIGAFYRRHGLERTLKMVKSSKNTALGVLSNREKQSSIRWLNSLGFDPETVSSYQKEIEQANLRKLLVDIRHEIRANAYSQGLISKDES